MCTDTAIFPLFGTTFFFFPAHRPEGSEKLRIEKAGGFVLRKRIMGLLAVSRSFGDVDSKPTHPLSTLGTYGGTYTGDFVISTFDFYFILFVIWYNTSSASLFNIVFFFTTLR